MSSARLRLMAAMMNSSGSGGGGGGTATNVLPEFQANTLELGKCLTYSRGGVSIQNNTKRIGVQKTTISETGTIKFKMISGFQIALAAYKGNAYASTNSGGELVASNGSWNWVTQTDEIKVNLTNYDTFAINIRYSDNTTSFQSNDLTNYIDITVIDN